MTRASNIICLVLSGSAKRGQDAAGIAPNECKKPLDLRCVDVAFDVDAEEMEEIDPPCGV